MKARTIISIMATAALLAACSSNDSTPVDNKPVAVNFRGGIGTRVSGAKWDGGELIGISALSESGGATKYANEEYTSDNEGVFSFKSGSEIFYEDANPVDFTAYYPFAGSTGTAAGVASKTIAATDESTTGTPTPQSQIDYLWATTSKVAKGTSVTFAFSHEMSELTLKFISGTGAPVVTNLGYTLSGIILNGNFDTSTGTATCGSTTGSLAMSGVNTQSTLILFPDASAQTASLTVTIGSNSYSATGITIPAMVAGKNYELDITLNNTGMSASASTISNWVSSGSPTSVTATM
jgi:hypothetical protein